MWEVTFDVNLICSTRDIQWSGSFCILTIICGAIGMANERAEGNLCPFSSVGVENSLRSPAPHSVMFCAFIHSVSQTGAINNRSDNSYLVVITYLQNLQLLSFSCHDLSNPTSYPKDAIQVMKAQAASSDATRTASGTSTPPPTPQARINLLSA